MKRIVVSLVFPCQTLDFLYTSRKNMELSQLSLLEIQSRIDAGEFSYQEVYDYFLERTKRLDPSLQAFVTIPRDIDEVHGLPIAIKDVFCETGIPTTAASRMLEGFVPPYESTVTARMK